MAGADVIVIGGGVVGCAIALRLREKGSTVLVLEKAVPGAEASSAAAGMLSAQSHAEPDSPVLELALRSAALHRNLADWLREATGIDVGFRQCGTLVAAFSDDELGRASARATWQRQAGLAAEPVTASRAREIEPLISHACNGGASFPDEAQVDSPLFARALSQAAAKAGAAFASGDPVRRVVAKDGRVRGVETHATVHHAATVVVAAGAWSSLVEGAGLPHGSVRPARGQIVELRMRPPLLERVLWSERGYVVPRADGRVLCGSTIEDVGYEKAVTARGVSQILAAALELVPDLGTAEVLRSWSGFRPVTSDELPLIGRCDVEGLVLATGHFTNGILLAPATAEAVAAIVARESPPVDVSRFSPTRLVGR